jgi:hypothetical protein
MNKGLEIILKRIDSTPKSLTSYLGRNHTAQTPQLVGTNL